MKTPSTDKRAGSIQLTTLGVALLLTGASAHAADQTKANNNDDLTTTTSWVSGTVPGMGDRAIWDSTVTTANVVNLGGDVNFGQIKIATPGGNVTFNTGNMLTLSGVSGVGIDMSAAGRDLTLNNDVTVGANQNWIVKNNPAPHSDVAGTRLFVPGFVNIAPGITLTIGPATPAPAGYVNWTADNSYTIVAGSQIIINGQNNADSPDNHTGGLSVDSIAQLGAASITVNSNASLYIRASGNYTYSQTITNNGGIIYNLTTDGGTTTWDGSPAIVTSDENNPAKFTGDYGSDKKWDVSGQITGAGGIQIIQPPSRMGGPGQCCNNPGSWFLSSSPANDYAGNTTVVQGAFENGASDVIPNGIGKGNMVLYATNTANLLNGSSYWFMSGFDETINGLSDGGFTSGRVTSGHPGSINDQSNGDPGTSTLTLGDNNTTASFRGILENNDTLNLVKIGTGIQTLGGINTYNGTTVISNGTLLVNGSLADGAVSINGGTLGGNGSMAGAVTAYAGGTISPGVGVGILTVSNTVTLDAASINLFDVLASTNDQLRVVGDLTPNASVITVNLGGAYLGASTNVLITYNGTETGNFSPVPNIINGSAGVASIDETVSGQVRLIINYAVTSADHLTVATQPSGSATAGVAFSQQPVVELRNPNNSVATGNSSTFVTASIVVGGVLQGTVTKQAVNGIVNFSGAGLNATNAGSITLRFSAVLANGLTTVDSSAITVIPAAANELAILTQPSASATVLVPFSVQPVVAVQDAYGNVISTDHSTVITATATNANLSGTVSVTVANGVATFAGLYLTNLVVNALDFTSSPSYLTVRSANITVVGGPAARLAIGTAPSASAVAGVTFATQPVIKVLDALGNVSSTNATITVTASTGNVQGNTTINAVNGIATFSGLSLTNVGNIILTFACAGLGSTNSPITVSGGRAVNFAWTTLPGLAVSNAPFGQQPVLKTVDRYGNPSTLGLPANIYPTVYQSAGTGPLLGTTNYNLGSAGNNGVVNFTDLQINSVGTDKQITAASAVFFQPTNAANCQLWLDASDLSGMTFNGPQLSQWNDKSGNARNAIQTTAAKQPTIVTNGLLVGPAGMGRAVRFVSANANTMNVDLSFLMNKNFTIYVVEGRTANGQHYFLGNSTGGVNNQSLHTGYRGDTTWTLDVWGGGLDYNGPPTYTSQVFRMWSEQENNAVGKTTWLNGVQVAANGNTAQLTGGMTAGRVGSAVGSYFEGDIAEVLIYDTAQDAATRQSIEAYLSNKWLNVSGTLPPSATTPAFTVTQMSGSQTNAIVGITRNGNGTSTIQFVGTVGVAYYVQTTTNLTSPIVWNPLAGSTNTVVNLNGTWSVLITNSLPVQFYRSAVVNP